MKGKTSMPMQNTQISMATAFLCLSFFGALSQTPHLMFISEYEAPLIDTRSTAGTEDIQFGFEGGKAIVLNSSVWYFTAELWREPIDMNMRLGLWRGDMTNLSSPWQRVTTLVVSNQTFPLIEYKQLLNNATTVDRYTSIATYKCNPDDLLASPWAPMPMFDASADRWAVLFPSYKCDGRSLCSVAGSGANAFMALSSATGLDGIAGPYQQPQIIAGPNASVPWNKSVYVNQIGPYRLPSGKYRAVVGKDLREPQEIRKKMTFIADATSLAGPWEIVESFKYWTPQSDFNENFNVFELPLAETSEIGYIAVFDTVKSQPSGFGMMYSRDGLNWSSAVDVVVPHGCRTPVGLWNNQDGKTVTVVFTRRFPDCNNQTSQPFTRWQVETIPSQCANVYAATFALTWQDTVAYV